LANDSLTISTGVGLSGGGTVALGNAITLNNTGVLSLTGSGGATVSGSNGNVTLGIDGTAITSLNADNISSGSLADARLSSNVPRLNSSYSYFEGSAEIAGDSYFDSDVTISGTTYSGVGNLTADGPGAGLIHRRLQSLSTTNGDVVALCDGGIKLIRDGSDGGFKIAYDAGAPRFVVALAGLNSSGTAVNKYATVTSTNSAGTVTLFTDAQNVVFFHCTFGDTYLAGHVTEVTLTRDSSDYYWIGTVSSSFNQ
jgi:hypothetical protein